jgi:hypothetical protein
LPVPEAQALLLLLLLLREVGLLQLLEVAQRGVRLRNVSIMAPCTLHTIWHCFRFYN